MRAVKNNVVIKVRSELDKGTIVLLSDTKENGTRGDVKAVGSEVTDVKVGDLVTFSAHAGFSFEMNGGHYKTMQENQVMLIL